MPRAIIITRLGSLAINPWELAGFSPTTYLLSPTVSRLDLSIRNIRHSSIQPMETDLSEFQFPLLFAALSRWSRLPASGLSFNVLAHLVRLRSRLSDEISQCSLAYSQNCTDFHFMRPHHPESLTCQFRR
jgi:hypothetical protein